MPWFWMSFCNPDLPKGQKFLGATIVEAPNALLAANEAWRIGVNPGGEIKFAELDIETADQIPPEGQKYVNKFVSREVVMAEPFTKF